jgi:ATPase subunit of ABC transporter with duplicated ATPase domains
MLERALNLIDHNRLLEIRGPNGSGKSTLIEQIALGLHNRGQRFGIYSQHEGVDESLSLLQLAMLLRGDPLAIARQLGVDDELAKVPISRLSSGERAKALLSLAIGCGDWVLLDEPFSHLDQSSKRSLAEIVQSSSKKFAIANHEPRLIKFEAELVLERILDF